METILAATDFSKPANAAVAYAAHLARFLNSKLVIVHAFNMPLGGYNIEAPLETAAAIREGALEKLASVRNQLVSDGFDPGIEIYADMGPVLTVIKDTANACGAELVVMGMTGEAGKVKQHLVGSATLRAARELSLPLLIISEHVGYKPVHNISLAAGPEGLETSTLLFSARAIATLFGAALEIVTVHKNKDRNQNPETNSFIDKKLQDTKHTQVFLREENKALALEYYFKFHETDMVMVCPGKHTVLQKLFSGSITGHLAFNIRVPLLVLH